jgi:uncharacterized membrane protein
MVLLRLVLAAMLLALSVPLAAPNAFAGEGEITFCNEFPQRVSIAIAYLQTDVNNHLTRGWLNVGSGKCYVFDTAIRVSTFYYRAESETYKDGKDKVKMNWGNETDFAVRDGDFQVYAAEKKYSGTRLVKFSKGPVSTGAPLTCTVTFLADGRSMTVVPGNKGAGPAAPPADEGERASPSSGDQLAPTAPSTGGSDSRNH